MDGFNGGPGINGRANKIARVQESADGGGEGKQETTRKDHGVHCKKG